MTSPPHHTAHLEVASRPLATDRRLLDIVPPEVDPGEVVAWTHVSGDDDHDEGLVGWGRAVVIRPGAGPQRFTAATQQLTALHATATVDNPVGVAGSGLVGIGSFTFADDDPGSVLIVPRRIVGRRDGITWTTTIDPVGAPEPPPAAPNVATDNTYRPRPPRDRPRYAGASHSDVDWLEAVANAVDRIRAGDLEKVVLARDVAVWSRTPFDALDLARRLQRRFASCYTFIVDDLVGATPELLVARSGRQVTSRVLAGTLARDEDPDRDRDLGETLLASAKDRHEHTLAVDSVRDVLAEHCEQLHVDANPWLLKLANVQHLATNVEGLLARDIAVLDIAGQLHPPAAVGGTPRTEAVALIRELEAFDRGRYAAPVGWMDANGDGAWGIALRCAQLAGSTARLFAGVGIVEGSLPEAELAETRWKLLAMQSVLGEQP